MKLDLQSSRPQIETISAECLDCLFLEGLIRIEVVKIEGAKVRNGAAVPQSFPSLQPGVLSGHFTDR
jgi:hypothetical protein